MRRLTEQDKMFHFDGKEFLFFEFCFSNIKRQLLMNFF